MSCFIREAGEAGGQIIMKKITYKKGHSISNLQRIVPTESNFYSEYNTYNKVN